MVGFNLFLYGAYRMQIGPSKIMRHRIMEVKQDSKIPSLFYFHFFNSNLISLFFNSALVYTIGNYHVLKYG